MRLQIDSSIDSMLPEGDGDRAFYDRARLLFGSDETILVALIADDVFSSDNLERIERLTRRPGAPLPTGPSGRRCTPLLSWPACSFLLGCQEAV